ncbi:MAG: hypothetical protein HYR96_15300 [Deltaproteobacteria bacterium]|nr:hypothetical protein [Deltaproteobacteria bacterium]MBI3296240.1 hypothetical protein [Deltaproteobacteria bacterium]
MKHLSLILIGLSVVACKIQVTENHSGVQSPVWNATSAHCRRDMVLQSESNPSGCTPATVATVYNVEKEVLESGSALIITVRAIDAKSNFPEIAAVTFQSAGQNANLSTCRLMANGDPIFQRWRCQASGYRFSDSRYYRLSSLTLRNPGCPIGQSRYETSQSSSDCWSETDSELNPVYLNGLLVPEITHSEAK